MTLKEACKESLKILKQVMEEKLNSTNVEVRNQDSKQSCEKILQLISRESLERSILSKVLIIANDVYTVCVFADVISFSFQMAIVTPGKMFQMFTKEELEKVIEEI